MTNYFTLFHLNRHTHKRIIKIKTKTKTSTHINKQSQTKLTQKNMNTIAYLIKVYKN